MKPKMYLLVEHCVEVGALRGYRRAHKHIEKPSENVLLDNIQNCIMEEFCEWFEFSSTDE